MKAIAPTSVAALLCLASPAYAQHEPAPNPMIDYAGFADLVTAVGPIREGRRLSWDQFAAALDRDRQARGDGEEDGDGADRIDDREEEDEIAENSVHGRLPVFDRARVRSTVAFRGRARRG